MQRGFDFASTYGRPGRRRPRREITAAADESDRLLKAASVRRDYLRQIQFIRLTQAEGKMIYDLDELKSISLIGRCLSNGLIAEAKELCSQVIKGSDEEIYVRQNICRIIN